MMRWLALLMSAVPAALMAASPGYAPMDNPAGPDSWWWDSEWWDQGHLPARETHRVDVRWIEYPNDDVMVPAMIARPAGNGRYPAVLYQHGRRGLDDARDAALAVARYSHPGHTAPLPVASPSTALFSRYAERRPRD